MLERWLAHPARIAALLAAGAAVAAFFMMRARLGPAAPAEQAGTVLVEHFGIDGAEMERSITLPLEDALASIAGVREIRSTSELGRTRVTVWLAGPVAASGAAIRDAVARVSAGFPSSAQKPRILGGAPSERPVLIAALRAPGMGEEELARMARREVEPAFARVPGVGEIEVGGGEVREVHVRVDARMASSRSLAMGWVAAELQEQCLLAPAGTLEIAGRDLPVIVRGVPDQLQEIADLPIRLPSGGASIRLRDIAEVSWGNRQRESISRVDGEPLVVLYARSAGSADPIALSTGLRAEAARWADRGVDVQVLYDSGDELRQGIASVVSAGLQGLAAVTVLLPLLVRGLRRLAVLWATLPLAAAGTAAALSALGVTLDRDVLAGLAVGMGTIIDTGVIVSGQRDRRSLGALVPALAASLATTLIVLLPLLFLSFAASGLRQMALAIGLLLVSSFVLSVLFLPAFSLGAPTGGAPAPRTPWLRMRRSLRRLLPRLVVVAMRRRWIVLGCSLALSAGAVAALVPMGIDFAAEPSADTVVAHVELESEAAVESSDARVAAYAAGLRAVEGVTMVESIARRGNGDVSLRFDPARLRRADALRLVRQLGARIPGAFVYVAEGAAGDRPIEVAVLGDDHAVLRELARSAAAALDAASAGEVVLEFKEPAPALEVRSSAERGAAGAVSAAEIAAGLRWAVHGPVALKWLDGDREVDLRVMADEELSPADLGALPVVDARGGVHALGSLAEVERQPEGTRLYRKDRQAAVFLTVTSRERSLDRSVATIRGALSTVPLPRGYAFEVDRSVAALQESLRTLWLVLALSVALVWIVLAALSESLFGPLVVLSILPTSLALPLLAVFATGAPLRAATLVALVVVSGMVVNNSILVFDGVRARGDAPGRGSRASAPRASEAEAAVALAVRRRARPLLLTTGATVIGTVPLLVAGAGGGLLGSLAFVILWGMLGSLASTVVVLPAVLAVAPRAWGRAERS